MTRKIAFIGKKIPKRRLSYVSTPNLIKKKDKKSISKWLFYLTDFIVTYGWAILLVLVIIGSLVYLGAFD